jgi:hypothetical protein
MSLSEVKQTRCDHRKSVAHDPSRPFAVRLRATQHGQRDAIPTYKCSISYSIT